jgi:hypothetical protein
MATLHARLYMLFDVRYFRSQFEIGPIVGGGVGVGTNRTGSVNGRSTYHPRHLRLDRRLM